MIFWNLYNVTVMAYTATIHTSSSYESTRYSLNPKCSLQEPRCIHRPLPRTTLGANNCTMECKVSQNSKSSHCHVFVILCDFEISLQGSWDTTPASQVGITSKFRFVLCAHLYFTSRLSHWLNRKQWQDRRLHPATHLLPAVPAERLRSQCCRRT